MKKELLKALSKIFYDPKVSSILIVGICIIGIIIGKKVEVFRFSNYRWVYEYGKTISLIMFLSSVFWSFLHPLIIWSENKTKWKKHVLWILFGVLPFIYVLAMIIVINFKN